MLVGFHIPPSEEHLLCHDAFRRNNAVACDRPAVNRWRLLHCFANLARRQVG